MTEHESVPLSADSSYTSPSPLPARGLKSGLRGGSPSRLLRTNPRLDPRIAPLRTDPRFQDLPRRMNFPPQVFLLLNGNEKQGPINGHAGATGLLR